MRAFLLQVHLWLGLATGAVLAVVCATGAVLAFEDEIVEALHPERYHVEARAERLPLAEVVEQARAAVPDADISSVTVSTDPGRSLALGAGRGRTVFADPYGGAVLGDVVYRETGMYTVFALHRWLLADDLGKMIVGVSTLLFLVILVTGVVTWWPKNRRQLGERLRVKAGAGWKRLNFDLHVSLGIYSTVLLFVMAVTGLAWSFEWVNDAIYWVTRSSQERPEGPTVEARPDAARLPLEAAVATAAEALPGAEAYTVGLPEDGTAPVSVSAVPAGAPHERARDTVHLDPVTGEVVAVERYADQSLGRRTRSAFYSWHVGSVWGLPSRVLFALACVVGATAPVTGAFVWWNKRSKRWRRQWRDRRGRASTRS